MLAEPPVPWMHRMALEGLDRIVRGEGVIMTVMVWEVRRLLGFNQR